MSRARLAIGTFCWSARSQRTVDLRFMSVCRGIQPRTRGQRGLARSRRWELSTHLDCMTDREHADAVLAHVAVLAFLYYPGIQVDDPTYLLAEDTEWCVARLGDVSDTERKRMRALIARAIIDPTATREELFTALAELNGVLDAGHDE